MIKFYFRLHSRYITFILLALIIFSIAVKAQTNQNIVYRVQYKIDSRTNNWVLYNDSCSLDISNSYSYFYSLGNIAFLNDLVKKSGKEKLSNNDFNSQSIQTCKTCYKNIFLKIYAKNNVYRVANLINSYYAYPLDSVVKQQWQIHSEKKIILNYECFKATTVIDGSNYEAWFTKDIAIQDGPIYLRGLPGLILKCTINNNTQIEASSIVNVDNNKKTNKLPYPFTYTTYKDFKLAEKTLREQLNSGQRVQFGDGSGSIQRKN